MRLNLRHTSGALAVFQDRRGPETSRAGGQGLDRSAGLQGAVLVVQKKRIHFIGGWAQNLLRLPFYKSRKIRA